MNLPQRIEQIGSRKLAGKRMKMSLAANTTHELWRSFMMSRKEISNVVGTDLYSMQVYPPSYFAAFDPRTEFEKWAVVEVRDFDRVAAGMETIVLPGGLYAVFSYKGDASGAPQMFGYIFGTWLPASDYLLDDRPHFELLGEKYSNNSQDSEEEIWIPVKPKN